MKKILFFILASLILSACSQVEKVVIKVDSKDIVEKTILSGLPTQFKFAKGKYSDKRPDITYLTKLSPGEDGLQFCEESPIEFEIFDGLKTLFSKARNIWIQDNISDNSDFNINVTLVDVSLAIQQALFLNRVESNIILKIDFISNASGNLLYSNIYYGSNDERHIFFDISDVDKSLNESIVNCINSIGFDKNLLAKLSEFKHN